jgi:hypothetical protein
MAQEPVFRPAPGSGDVDGRAHLAVCHTSLALDDLDETSHHGMTWMASALQFPAASRTRTWTCEPAGWPVTGKEKVTWVAGAKPVTALAAP